MGRRRAGFCRGRSNLVPHGSRQLQDCDFMCAFLTLLYDAVLEITSYIGVRGILVLQRAWSIDTLRSAPGVNLTSLRIEDMSFSPKCTPSGPTIFITAYRCYPYCKLKLCTLVDMHPVCAYVKFAFLVPGTAGRCLLTVTSSSMIVFWELDVHPHRSKRSWGWVVRDLSTMLFVTVKMHIPI